MVNQSVPARDAVVRAVGAEDDQRQLLDALTLRLAGRHRRKTLSDVQKEKRKVIPTPATAKLVLGEFLWIIRPLVYRTPLALAIRVLPLLLICFSPPFSSGASKTWQELVAALVLVAAPGLGQQELLMVRPTKRRRNWRNVSPRIFVVLLPVAKPLLRVGCGRPFVGRLTPVKIFQYSPICSTRGSC